jgi:hypothetical protein
MSANASLEHEQVAMERFAEKLNYSLNRIKATLLAHYTAPQVTIFKTLRTGFILFFSGLITLYIAINNIPPSLEQEILTLLGLIVGAIGFGIAILAYIRLVISRLVVFFTRK